VTTADVLLTIKEYVWIAGLIGLTLALIREHDPIDYEDPVPLAAYCAPPQAVHASRWRRKRRVKPTFLSCAPGEWREDP
jgi:hypothetical protein